MHLDLPHRFPWSTVLSVALHGAAIVGLLYLSVNQVVELPGLQQPQPISVSLVAPPAPEPAQPPAVQPPPEPVAEPEPEPVPEPIPEPPKEAPVVIHKPKPKPKPKPEPKPEKKVEPVKPVPKPAPKPVDSKPVTPVENQATRSAAPPTTTKAPAGTPSAPSASVSGDPRPLSRSNPQYPRRAYTFRIDGTVRVKFDVNNAGDVRNIEILSAQPANMFEREVKQAMKKWRYEPGKPAEGMVVTVEFRIVGGTSVN